MNLGVGIHSDIPLDDYVRDRLTEQPTLSSGIVHELLTKSPLHALYAHPRLNPKWQSEETSRFDLGTAAHEALLQGIDRCVVVAADDWRTKAAREERDKARAAGFIPLLEKHYKPLTEMVETAKDYVAHSEIAGVFDSGEAEQTIIWREGELWFRARPDWLNESVCLHYKTCGNAQPDGFIRGPMTSFGYDTALAYYERGLTATHPNVAHVILAQECEPPYQCSLIGLSPAMADYAASRVDRAIRIWRACLENDVWQGYPRRIAYAEPKPWQLAEEEEQTYRAMEIDAVQSREGIEA